MLRFHSEYDLQNRAPLAGLYSTKACASRSFFYLFPVNRTHGPHELAASAILPPHSPLRLNITARDNSLTPEDRVYTLIPRYLSLRFGKTSDISQFSRRKSRYFDVKNNQYYPNRQVIHHIKSHRRHNKSAHSSDAARSIRRLFLPCTNAHTTPQAAHKTIRKYIRPVKYHKMSFKVEYFVSSETFSLTDSLYLHYT